MAQKRKTTELTSLDGSNVDVDTDVLMVVDTSETQPVNRNKKITVQELADAVVQSADAFTQSGSGAIPDTVEHALHQQPVSALGWIPTALHAGIAAGTDTTDLTTYLQAWLDATPTAGGTRYLPPGTYNITADLVIRRSNTRLIGAGAGTTTLKIKTTWTSAAASVINTVHAMLNLVHSGNVLISDAVQINNVEISGIRFLGVRPTADADTAPKAISSLFAHNVSVHHNIFEEICREVIWQAGTGIASSSNWRINDNHFTNCGVLANSSDQSCVNLNADDSTVNNNTFDDVGSAIALYALNGTAVGNSIRDVLQWGIKVGEAANQGDGATISNNAISIVANATREVRGIHVVGQSGGGGRRISIVGNTIRLKSLTGMVQPKAILCGSSSVGAENSIRVSSNTILLDMDSVATTTTGIQLIGDGSKVEVNDNTIQFVNVPGSTDHAGIRGIAGNGVTMTTMCCNNRVFGADAISGMAIDLTRTGTGVHIVTALGNVIGTGYHRYDNTTYGTNNVNGVPVSFVSASGASGVGTVSGLKTSGATSVADGGTVTHKLGATPTSVRVTPSTSGEFVSVTAVGATTFTVAIKKHDNTAGTTQTIYWEAEAAPS